MVNVLLEWTLAIEALSWIELRRISERRAIHISAKQLNVRDENVLEKAKQLVHSVLLRKNTLDHLINNVLSPSTLNDYKLGTRNVLRLYTHLCKYQQISMKNLSLFIDHCIQILGKKEINPINFALDLIPYQEIEFNTMKQDQQMALKTFHPIWYIKYLKKTFGEKRTKKLLSTKKYPSYIRMNYLKEPLSKNKIRELKVEKEKDISLTYRLTNEKNSNLPQYVREGRIVIQDKASILSTIIASPEPGFTVLDVCCAPGMKTSHMAQLMKNQGKIYSIDSSQRRLDVWDRIMKQLGVTCAVPILGDARKQNTYPNVFADLVVLDPPCTGTGLFVKFPGLKWRINKNSIKKMSQIQKAIIDQCADHVRPDGNLIYGTCSITYEENEGVIKWLLSKRPDFKLVATKPVIGCPGINQKHVQRLYPDVHECNGFFIAKLTRE